MEQSMRIAAAGLGAAVMVLAIMATRSAQADVVMTGTFTATQACPAYQSFRKSTDPGDVKVEQNKTYARPKAPTRLHEVR